MKTFKKYLLKKIIAFLLLFVLVVPSTTQAFLGFGDISIDPPNLIENAGSLVTSLKGLAVETLKQVGMSLARQMLAKITESTINWINGGFEGSPQFVENPGQFLKNTYEADIKNLIDTIGYDTENLPYGRGIAVSLIKEYVRVGQGKENPARALEFTLDSTIGPNWKNFSTDFSQGGMTGYQALVSNPANNPIGAWLVAKNRFNQEIYNAEQSIDRELTQNNGFLNQKVCTKRRSGPKLDLVQPAGTYSGSNTGVYSNNTDTTPTPTSDPDCLEYKTISPGSVVESQINTALTSKIRSQELATIMGDISSSIGAILNALTNQLTTKGLSALGSAFENEEATDEWTYEGMSLDGGDENSLTGGGNGLNIGDKTIIDLQELLVDGPASETEERIVYDDSTINFVTKTNGEKLYITDGSYVFLAGAVTKGVSQRTNEKLLTMGNVSYLEEEVTVINILNKGGPSTQVYIPKKYIIDSGNIIATKDIPANKDKIVSDQVTAYIVDMGVKNPDQYKDSVTGKVFLSPGDTYIDILKRDKTLIDSTDEEIRLRQNIVDLINGTIDIKIETNSAGKKDFKLIKRRDKKSERESEVDSLAWQTMILDQCLPGPDTGWENRFKDILQEYKKNLEEDSKENSRQIKRLNRQSNSIKQEIKLKALSYNIESYNESLSIIKRAQSLIKNAASNENELFDKQGVVSRLKSIKKNFIEVQKELATERLEPIQNPGKIEQKREGLLEIIKQFASIKKLVSNSESVINAENEYNNIISTYSDIIEGQEKCFNERGGLDTKPKKGIFYGKTVKSIEIDDTGIFDNSFYMPVIDLSYLGVDLDKIVNPKNLSISNALNFLETDTYDGTSDTPFPSDLKWADDSLKAAGTVSSNEMENYIKKYDKDNDYLSDFQELRPISRKQIAYQQAVWKIDKIISAATADQQKDMRKYLADKKNSILDAIDESIEIAYDLDDKYFFSISNQTVLAEHMFYCESILRSETYNELWADLYAKEDQVIKCGTPVKDIGQVGSIIINSVKAKIGSFVPGIGTITALTVGLVDGSSTTVPVNSFGVPIGSKFDVGGLDTDFYRSSIDDYRSFDF